VKRYPVYSKYDGERGKKRHGREGDTYLGVGLAFTEQLPEDWDEPAGKRLV
jgi:hypothetical protein